MDRLLPGLLIFICLLVAVGTASGVGAALPVDSTAPSVSAAVTGDETESDDHNATNTSDAANVTDVDPTFENVTVPIEDAEPFEFGTTVVVQEQTLMSMTLRADEADIQGNVSVRESQTDAVDTLAETRTVHDAIDVTVPENATDVPATLRLVVRAHPVADRDNLEVMRYSNGEWEPLETTVASNRTWSNDRGASVLLVEAETPGFSTFAVTETDGEETDADAEEEVDSEAEQVDEDEIEADNQTTFVPPPEAEVFRISDRRPFEFGTHVHIHEETVREITFSADNDEIEGFVAINESNSSAVDELEAERSVVRAFNITATENASQTPAVLHLAVRAIAVDSREDTEVMRYDSDAGSWEPLQTDVVSQRYWSEDHQATVFDVEAETPGFSMFAVTEQPEEPEPEESQSDPEPESEQLADDESTDDGGLLFGFGFLEIGVVVVVVLGGLGAVAVVRRR